MQISTFNTLLEKAVQEAPENTPVQVVADTDFDDGEIGIVEAIKYDSRSGYILIKTSGVDHT